VEVEALIEGKEIKTPTKVYLLDGTIILFQNGFHVENNQITGNGTGYYLNNQFDEKRKHFSVPLKNVAVLTYHESSVNPGSGLGSFIMGLTAPPLTILAVYCLADPKACFGSCPTVYVRENNQYEFTSELFSYCISPYMEANDLDLLIGNLDKAKESVEIRVTNEALETHFINA
jgi:hypothetical protein